MTKIKNPLALYVLNDHIPKTCSIFDHKLIDIDGSDIGVIVLSQTINGEQVNASYALRSDEFVEYKSSGRVPGHVILRYESHRRKVREIVRKGSADSPCPYSVPVIDVFRIIMLNDPIRYSHIHDPFAGAGERMERLADHLGIVFTGTEIEPAFIRSSCVAQGDSTDPSSYPVGSQYAIVTSPVYPNGMADDHEARDQSKRNTYRARLGTLMHQNNMGGKGYRGTKRGGASLRRRQYWNLAERCVQNWGGAHTVLVNVSDFIHTVNGQRLTEPVVSDWVELLTRHGWVVVDVHDVKTQRQRYGANRIRVEKESIIEAFHGVNSPHVVV